MERKYILGMALAALLGYTSIGWTASSFDQDRTVDKRFYIAPMASYGFFNEDSFDPDNQFGAQLGLGKTLTQHLALELYAFHFNGVDLNRSVTGNSDVDMTGYGLSALIFPARDVLPIFGIVGLGSGNYDFNKVVFPAGTNNQDSNFVDLGIGFMAPLNDFGLALRAEYRYRQTDVDSPGGGQFKFRDNVVSLGLQIPLGAKPKPAAEPVAAPTPQPAPAPATTATPADSDGDGVPDSSDQCPGTPPGTEVDANGCPVEEEAPIVLKGVQFEYNSAKLTADAQDRLDNVVNALKGSSDIDVRIEGHTDSLGNAAYNLKLSQERADSVKRYLVDHGISSSRLTTKGYGETRPVAPNTKPDGSDNPAGRAKNRRVELHVTE